MGPYHMRPVQIPDGVLTGCIRPCTGAGGCCDPSTERPVWVYRPGGKYHQRSAGSKRRTLAVVPSGDTGASADSGETSGCLCQNNKRMVFECHHKCRCASQPDSCHNRVVQRGFKGRLQVFRTRNRGWGLRTLDAIPQQTYVFTYIGELIDETEHDRRKDDTYFMQTPPNQFGSYSLIDSKYFGNMSRFCNTSCKPNLACHQV